MPRFIRAYTGVARMNLGFFGKGGPAYAVYGHMVIFVQRISDDLYHRIGVGGLWGGTVKKEFVEAEMQRLHLI